MGLGKILDIQGMENAPSKANQTPNGYRIARNVLPTPDNTLIPRYDSAVFEDTPASANSVLFSTQYGSSVLSLYGLEIPSEQFLSTMAMSKDGVRVPNTNSFIIDRIPQQLPLKSRINNTVYFQGNYFTRLMKYDGVELSKAGVEQPRLAVTPYVAAGTRFVKAVLHTMDFDSNQPASEFVQFSTNASFNVQMTHGIPAGYKAIPPVDTSTSTNIEPKARTPSFYDDLPWFLGSATLVSGDFEVTATATNITTAHIGAWVFIAHASTICINFGEAANIFGMALQIKSVSGSTITFEGSSIKKYKKEALTWIDEAPADPSLIASSINRGFRKMVSFWESVSNGAAGFRALQPYYDSDSTSIVTHFNLVVSTTGNSTPDTSYPFYMLSIAPYLNSWYDVTTRKLDPSAQFDFGDGESYGSFVAMTTFQGNLLLASSQYIWESDSSAGGSKEQLNAALSYVIGDAEYGRITCICATNDFLLVGRERKNYFVTGTLSTGNYIVQEIAESELGPWCSNSAKVVGDSIVFINPQGVWALSSGGRCEKLSKLIPKNFETYSNNSINEDVVFRMTGFNASLTNIVEDSYDTDTFGLSLSYDEYRGLLCFMKRQVDPVALILNTSSGKFYEWNGLGGSDNAHIINCIDLIQSEYYLGESSLVYSDDDCSILKEDKSASRSYLSDYPATVITSWLTSGEPSLEKEVLQLKVFGRISGTAGVQVKQYKDWDRSTLITDVTYHPLSSDVLDNQVQYSHKQRLNSSKCLAFSVGVELDSPDSDFEIEGLEIELNSIQAGMKR